VDQFQKPFDRKYVELSLELFEKIRSYSVDGEGVTRDGFSEMETKGMEIISEVARTRNLTVSSDKVGNRVIELTGKDVQRVTSTGSHMDTVPVGGNYDGLAGIIGALMCLIRMIDEGIVPPTTIKLIIFRCEEGACYGLPCLGSRTLFGKLSIHDLQRTHRYTGISLKENMQSCGVDVSFIERGEKLFNKTDFESFIELHIEQGPTLDKMKIPVGVVTNIIGCRRIEAEIIGKTGHSGALPREDRNDAVFAFSDFTQRCDKKWESWLQTKREYMTMTIGKVHTEEKMEAFTRIPDRVMFCLEVRAMAVDILDGFWKLIMEIANEVSNDRGVSFKFNENSLGCNPQTKLHVGVINYIAQICVKSNLAHRMLPSAAGHDSVFFSEEGIPTGMIFVRNQNGSHNKDEAMQIEDFMLGCAVLFDYLNNPYNK